MIFLKWAAIFFIIALIAAVFGFSGIAAGAVDIAQTLFFIFLATMQAAAWSLQRIREQVAFRRPPIHGARAELSLADTDHPLLPGSAARNSRGDHNKTVC